MIQETSRSYQTFVHEMNRFRTRGCHSTPFKNLTICEPGNTSDKWRIVRSDTVSRRLLKSGWQLKNSAIQCKLLEINCCQIMLPFGGRHSAFEIEHNHEYEVILGLNNLAKSPVVISVRLPKLFLSAQSTRWLSDGHSQTHHGASPQLC